MYAHVLIERGPLRKSFFAHGALKGLASAGVRAKMLLQIHSLQYIYYALRVKTNLNLFNKLEIHTVIT